jgi:hypothetical protein
MNCCIRRTEDDCIYRTGHIHCCVYNSNLCSTPSYSRNVQEEHIMLTAFLLFPVVSAVEKETEQAY